MCGRTNLQQSPLDVAREFGIGSLSYPWKPSYNIAPTQNQWVIMRDGADYVCKPLRWGLIPSWSDDPAIGNSLINARADTVEIKPSFRNAVRKRRCLVIVSGWYEWMRDGKVKRPFYYHRKDDRLITLAGIWERNHKVGEEPVDTCAVITTDPPQEWGGIHNRCPVIIGPLHRGEWVNRANYLDLLKTPDASAFDVYEVSTFVNSPRNNTVKCLERFP